MAVSNVTAQRQPSEANQMIVRFTPSTSYPSGGEPILALLQALTFDGVKPINSVLDIKAGVSIGGVLGAVWAWDGATILKAFCLVSGIEAATGLDVSTAVVTLLVTYI